MSYRFDRVAPGCCLILFLMVSACSVPWTDRSGFDSTDEGTASFRYVGRVHHEALTEVSGMAGVPGGRQSFWVHNDSGDSPRVYEVLPGETVIRTVSLAGASAVDWEDADVGPCGEGWEGECLYVADIGDNAARRKHVSVYRLPLGTVPVSLKGDSELLIRRWDRVDFRYPDGPRNAEALLVHPGTEALFVVEKKRGFSARVYRVPRRFGRTETIREARGAGRLDLPDGPSSGWTITGGDFAPDGSSMVLLTYRAVLTVCDPEVKQDTVVASSTPKVGPRPPLEKAEALTFGNDRPSIWVTGEGTSPPFYRLDPVNSCMK